MRRRRVRLSSGVLVLALLTAGFTLFVPRGSATSGLSSIKHIVVIMQENRSFDSYFGTFPGAAGFSSSSRRRRRSRG
jgi:phospholipase C